ncbi:phosphonopyruvate decarboxylase [Lachnospiraceae bacterium]|nr:phosphonopyruvate decarboxylase [Lachnospiraceae bacterium]
MDVKKLVEIIGADFYTGVPDSQLRALCDYMIDVYGIDPKHHVIGANEGNCAALAAGYHLATGKVPVVYMQNSGEGNIINPVASLLHGKVYGIPCVFLIGWRGEPGVHDEPQHIYQGEITLKLLEDMGIDSFVVGKDTAEEELRDKMKEYDKLLAKGKNVAFVIRKGALQYEKKVSYSNNYMMVREDIIRHIAQYSGDDPVVSTTGKASRELFEIRQAKGQGHQYDFLTVGSMGHASSIALGIALHRTDRKIWCIDGDGAALMHMGAMAVIGQAAPDNLVHIVINNGAHESVGGMPTAAGEDGLKLVKVAEGCGYRRVYCAENYEELDDALKSAKEKDGLAFIEVKAAIGAREDLGRPSTTPVENKEAFMGHLFGELAGKNKQN